MRGILQIFMPNPQTKTLVVDTNIWISSMIEAETFHYESKRIIARHITTGFTIVFLPPVIIEIINILTRHGWSRQSVNREVHTLLSIKNTRVASIENNLLFEQAINLSIKQNIRSQDFLILVYCQLIKPDKFVTFDKKLQSIFRQINSNKDGNR